MMRTALPSIVARQLILSTCHAFQREFIIIPVSERKGTLKLPASRHRQGTEHSPREHNLCSGDEVI